MAHAPGVGPLPLKLHLTPGRYLVCTCGKTSTPPHCDGAHAGTSARPATIVLDRDTRYAWCRCGQSADAPTCDGTHRSLGGQPPAS